MKEIIFSCLANMDKMFTFKLHYSGNILSYLSHVFFLNNYKCCKVKCDISCNNSFIYYHLSHKK